MGTVSKRGSKQPKLAEATPAPAPAPIARHWRLLAAAAPLLLAVFLLAPMLAYPFGSDHGVFATAADAISHGQMPYRDLWENKPPAVDYLFWAGFHAFGRSMAAIRLLDLLWTLATALLLYLLGRRLFTKWTGLAAAFSFVTFYAVGFIFWDTAQCDGFASLPLTAAVLLALISEARRKPWLALLSGALVGLAITFKFTVGGLLLIPLLLPLLAREQTLAPRLTRGAAALLGGLAFLALIVALLWKAHAFHAFYATVFTWNAAYSQLKANDPLGLGNLYRFLLDGPYPIQKLVGALALYGLGCLVWKRPARWWVVPAWFVLMFAGVVAQGKYYAYHWLPVLPPLALLAGHGAHVGFESLRRPFSKRETLAVSVVLGAGLAYLLLSAWWTQFSRPVQYSLGRLSAADYQAGFVAGGAYFSFSADEAVAQYVQEHSQPDRPIFIWGLEPLVYFLADRPAASRYTYPIALMAPWSGPEMKQQAMEDLARTRPLLVLVVRNDAQPWATGWMGDSYSYLDQGQFPAFRAWLKENYQPAQQIEDFEIWQRR